MARARSGAAAAGARAELDRGHGNVAVPKIMLQFILLNAGLRREDRGPRAQFAAQNLPSGPQHCCELTAAPPPREGEIVKGALRPLCACLTLSLPESLWQRLYLTLTFTPSSVVGYSRTVIGMGREPVRCGAVRCALSGRFPVFLLEPVGLLGPSIRPPTRAPRGSYGKVVSSTHRICMDGHNMCHARLPAAPRIPAIHSILQKTKLFLRLRGVTLSSSTLSCRECFTLSSSLHATNSNNILD